MGDLAREVLQATLSQAVSHFQAGRLDQAEALCRRALDVAPDQPEALNLLGVILSERGNPLLALKALDRSIALDPRRPAFHGNRGEILRRWGLPEEAIESCRRALELEPRAADALNTQGLALMQLGRAPEAVRCFQAAREANPAMPEPAYNLGGARKMLGDWPGAVEAQRAAIALRPGYAEAWYEIGCVLERLDDLDGAAAACRRALELRAVYPEAWAQLGDVLLQAGDQGEAIAAYRRSVALAPGLATSLYRLSLALLGHGDFDEGWRLYESRHAAGEGLIPRPPPLPMPRWQGESLAGRRLLIVTEQGYGDHIQLARFVPLLARQGVGITLGVSPELESLMLGLEGATRVVSRLEDTWASGCDRWEHIGSLPLRLGLRADAIPAPMSYLRADARKSAAWHERLTALGPGRKVGLVWAGRPTHANDWRRSIPFESLAPLASIPDVHWIGLQKGDRAADVRSAMAGPKVLALGDQLGDFADSAALIDALDLLISVDSAPAHLAGALGRPVWTLLPMQPDWRWRPDGERSRWYPTMRLIRQRARGDWGGVVDRVAQALRAGG